ncbi:hypothetical protein LSG31_10235 [Fodinisporobacter ferrooxydans]|uniref:Uncharacterized protein n=1 Tax=Fodinisporobacter ferrooxydans TaxID=2901836 RepID=A0ABY4CR97_9BACL|nr:hypothetical protein LSG31_10235 [Alicyclobacillaceae bacterium MYW30-H2]
MEWLDHLFGDKTVVVIDDGKSEIHSKSSKSVLRSLPPYDKIRKTGI